MLKRYFNRYNRIGNLTEPTCFKINTFVYCVCIYIYIYILQYFLIELGGVQNEQVTWWWWWWPKQFIELWLNVYGLKKN